MGLVINHNMAAQVAYRNLSATYRQLAESVNALSSGLRINSAGDDAAEMWKHKVARLEHTAEFCCSTILYGNH